MSSEVNAHLRQQGCYGQQREYQIVKGRHIRIAIGSKTKHKIFNVPMLALAEKSKLRLHIAWAWLWLAACGLVAIPVYLLIKSGLGLNARILDFVILAALVAAALVGLVMLARNFARKRVFFTAYSKVPLFDILISKPDHQSYKDFLDILESYLHQNRSEWNLKTDQQIAGEIRMLRRLAGEGVISQKVYEAAKDRLFSISNKSSRSAG
ncbi:MAG: hypothetical protein GC149_03660 [Gammaproteobacteria bacterium]|nr:hypothetical protein [Gammaproteobacteria bacterium]